MWTNSLDLGHCSSTTGLRGRTPPQRPVTGPGLGTVVVLVSGTGFRVEARPPFPHVTVCVWGRRAPSAPGECKATTRNKWFHWDQKHLCSYTLTTLCYALSVLVFFSKEVKRSWRRYKMKEWTNVAKPRWLTPAAPYEISMQNISRCVWH